MEQSFLTYEETDMAVFREKNGTPSADGCSRRRTDVRVRPGLLTLEQSIFPHPRRVRDSANERNVRAAIITSDGFVNGKEV
jgi:hypothetical protein